MAFLKTLLDARIIDFLLIIKILVLAYLLFLSYQSVSLTSQLDLSVHFAPLAGLQHELYRELNQPMAMLRCLFSRVSVRTPPVPRSLGSFQVGRASSSTARVGLPSLLGHV